MRISLLTLLAFTTLLSATAQDDRVGRMALLDAYNLTNPFLNGSRRVLSGDYLTSSAVILDEIALYEYGPENVAGYLYVPGKEKITYRILIKINDKASLERFSTFSYDNSVFVYGGYRNIQVHSLRVRKPTGEEIEINLDELEKNAEEKVAIPMLEVNDILDYTKVTEQLYGGLYALGFQSNLRTLTGEFPVLNGYMRITLKDDDYYVNFQHSNGAPPLVQNDLFTHALIYELPYDSLPARQNERWAPAYRSEPTIKFQICSDKYESKEVNILGEPGKVHSKASRAAIEKSVRGYFDEYVDQLDIEKRLKHFEKWYKANYRDATISSDEFMEKAYYYFRYYAIVFDAVDNEYNDSYHTTYLKPNHFLKLMSEIADSRKIENDMLVTNSKEICDFEDVLLTGEYITLFRYRREDGSWKIFETPMAYQTSEYLDPRVQGQSCISLNSITEELTLPEGKPNDNVNHVRFNISADLENRSAGVKSRNSVTGVFKYQMSRNVLHNTDYHEEVASAMLEPGKFDAILNKGKVSRGMRLSAEAIQADEELKLKNMKELRSENFDVDTYTGFKIVNSGVVSSSDSLIFEEEFVINDVVEKAGPNYILNVSKISYDQVSFTEKEKEERKNDIRIDFPKIYSYEYRIAIPEGYEVKGWEKLTDSASSPYGKVDMKALVEGDDLVILLTKEYSKSYIPKEEWAELLKFLEPAMKMNDTKIVFKKLAQG